MLREASVRTWTRLRWRWEGGVFVGHEYVSGGCGAGGGGGLIVAAAEAETVVETAAKAAAFLHVLEPYKFL